jgi:integrase
MSSKKICVYSADGDLKKRWFVHYKQDGKRIRVYGNINTYITAGERFAAIELLIQSLSGETLAESATAAHKTLSEELLEDMEARRNTMRKKSWQTYASRVKYFILWCNANNVLYRSALTVNDCINFFNYLLKKGIKPATVAGYRVTLSAMLGADFIKLAKTPKFEHTPARRFSDKEVKNLIEKMEKTDNELLLFVKFLYYCFVRPRTELRLLTADCLLLDEGQLVIPAALSKSKKTRYIPIPDIFLKELKEVELGTPYLFGGQKPTGHNTMANRHKKILAAVGLSPAQYKLYSWRHTAAIAAHKKGVPIKVLQNWMGHSSPDITDKYLRQMGASDTADYTHLVSIY